MLSLRFYDLQLVQHVPHFLLFRVEVVGINLIDRNFHGHALDHFKIVALECDNLLWIVRHQPHSAHAKIAQDLRSYAVVAQIGLKSQSLVSLDGVVALILELVRLQLVHQSDTPALLA